MADDSALIDRFFSSFEVLNPDGLLTISCLDDSAEELATGKLTEDGYRYWRPQRITTNPAALQSLYTQLAARLPRLYESCLLSYRWAELDSGFYTLLGNPPGPDLERLLGNMKRDQALWNALVPSGYLQFGKGPDMDYDPVCFDLNRRRHSGDCPIVKIDHEGILSFNKISIVEELAKSFRDLVECTIDRAQKKTVPQE